MPHVISPFVIPVPVSLDYPSSRGRRGEFSQIRDLRTAEPFRVVGTQFVGTTIDSNFWTAANSGAGSGNAQVTGVATASGGTAAAGYAMVRSVRIGRFIFAHPMIWRGAMRIPTVVVANTSRMWGVFTHTAGVPQDGFYFSLDGSGVLSVVSAKAGTPSAVASGSFNGEVSSYTLDTNVHAFEIHYYVMGIEFYIDNVFVHRFTPTTAPLEGAGLNLPICFGVLNTAGSAGATLEAWSTTITRIGRQETSPIAFRQSGTTAGVVLKRGAGQLHQINLSNVSTNAAVTLWDNTAASGTAIWASGTMPALTTPFTLDLHEIPFFIGLTLQIATAACDCVVAYE